MEAVDQRRAAQRNKKFAKRVRGLLAPFLRLPLTAGRAPRLRPLPFASPSPQVQDEKLQEKAQRKREAVKSADKFRRAKDLDTSA